MDLLFDAIKVLVGGALTLGATYLIQLKTKRIDDAATIRNLLLEELGNVRGLSQGLQVDSVNFREMYFDERARSSDFQLEAERFCSKLIEASDLLSKVVEVENCLSEGNLRRAKRLIEEIERERKAFEEKQEREERARMARMSGEFKMPKG